jgi:hypothetical protein
MDRKETILGAFDRSEISGRDKGESALNQAKFREVVMYKIIGIDSWLTNINILLFLCFQVTIKSLTVGFCVG